MPLARSFALFAHHQLVGRPALSLNKNSPSRRETVSRANTPLPLTPTLTPLTLNSPSVAGTLSRANTVPALPSSAALPIHHLIAPSSGVLITHCVGQHVVTHKDMARRGGQRGEGQGGKTCERDGLDCVGCGGTERVGAAIARANDRLNFTLSINQLSNTPPSPGLPSSPRL